MPELAPEIDIRPEEAEAIARGLYAVAKADGVVHPAEAALIGGFFAETSDLAANLGALDRSEPISGEALAAQLASTELRHLFLKTAMLLAYADGKYDQGESRLIGEFAGALEVDPAQLEQLEGEVKEYMLSQLSHLKNTPAVVEVAKELKL